MKKKPTAKKKLGGITGKGFMPGQSGNPNGGKTKERRVTDALASLTTVPYSKVNPQFNKILDAFGIDADQPRSVVLAEMMWYAATIQLAKGNISIAAELLNRIEGKVTQPISGPEGGPIDVRYRAAFTEGAPLIETTAKNTNTT